MALKYFFILPFPVPIPPTQNWILRLIIILSSFPAPSSSFSQLFLLELRGSQIRHPLLPGTRRWQMNGESESHPVVFNSLRPHGFHGILQARILEWVAFPFSKGSSQPRDRTQVSHIAGGFFTSVPPGKLKNTRVGSLSLLQQIFPTQESNQGLLHCRQILYQLSYQGRLMKKVSTKTKLELENSTQPF